MARYRVSQYGPEQSHNRAKVTLNGWDTGFSLVAYLDKVSGLDTFEVWDSGGDNGAFPPKRIVKTTVPLRNRVLIQRADADELLGCIEDLIGAAEELKMGSRHMRLLADRLRAALNAEFNV